jgi:hypothetical protein
MLAGLLAMLLLRGAVYITVLDFWWPHPRPRAFLLVLAYWAGLTATVVACVAGLVVLQGSGSRWRIAGFTAVAGCVYVLVNLTMEPVRSFVGITWDIAIGNAKPAAVMYERDSRQIRISGGLDTGSAARFKEVLEEAADARIVDVSGPGGLIYEARWISHLIEQRGLDTIITSECHSACVGIFASGTRRLMHAKAVIGLHSARSLHGGAAGAARANDAFSARLYKIGVEPRFLMVGNDTPADDIWINTARQAYLAGLATEVVGQ